MFAVIGGSGFEKFEGFEVLEELGVDTPFGKASSGLKRVRVSGKEILFISRHGERHELLPSEINYRANIYALKAFGVRAVISFSAVGSLQAPLAPGDLVIPTQYVDRTKGLRKHTFCGDGVVGHMSLAYPVCKGLAEQAFALAQGENIKANLGGTYVCIEGPNFSTLSESLSYRAMNADIIGMTNFPEYALAREAGLTYLPCCFVTDYDCWDTTRPHVTLEEVITIMRQNNSKAFRLLKKILSSANDILAGCDCANQGLRTGLFVPRESLSATQQQWLSVLTS
jgi:5'-methylthioadenosine phosphorylase